MKKIFFIGSLIGGIISIILLFGGLPGLVLNFGDSYGFGISLFISFWGIVFTVCSWFLYKYSKRS